METITLSAGETYSTSVTGGGTLSDILIDASAGGCTVSIVAQGSGWTIENIGIRGRLDNSGTPIISVADTGGGHSHIEHVYLGDGTSTASDAGPGIYVRESHRGRISIDRAFIAEISDHGVYASAPGAGNPVTIRDCYSANCGVAQWRLASGEIINCHTALDTGHRDGRGVWAWGGDVAIERSTLEMRGRHLSIASRGASVTVDDTDWDDGYGGGTATSNGGSISFGSGNTTDPAAVFPSGIPTSAQQGASGTGWEPPSEDDDDDEDDEDEGGDTLPDTDDPPGNQRLNGSIWFRPDMV